MAESKGCLIIRWCEAESFFLQRIHHGCARINKKTVCGNVEQRLQLFETKKAIAAYAKLENIPALGFSVALRYTPTYFFTA